MSRRDEGADWFADDEPDGEADETTSVADATWLASLRRRAAESGRPLADLIDDGAPTDDDEHTQVAADIMDEVRAAVESARAHPPEPEAEPELEPQPAPAPVAPPPTPTTDTLEPTADRSSTRRPTPVPGPRWEAPPRLAAADEFVESTVHTAERPRLGRTTIVAIVAAVVIVFVLGVLAASVLGGGDAPPAEDPAPTLPDPSTTDG